MGFLLEGKGYIRQLRVPAMTSVMSLIGCCIICLRMYLQLVTVGGWLMSNWNKEKSKLYGLYGRNLAFLRLTVFMRFHLLTIIK